MLSLPAKAAILLSFALPILGQSSPASNQFTSEIPQSEAAKLSQIVEDEPINTPANARKGGADSPAYTLYSSQLPIPPVAQVKQ